MIDFKPGDKVQVNRKPEGLSWYSASEDESLKNGDILVVANPVITQYTPSFVKLYMQPQDTTQYSGLCVRCVSGGVLSSFWMPIEWVDAYASREEPKVCECDLWVGGCHCGAFKAEQERKHKEILTRNISKKPATKRIALEASPRKQVKTQYLNKDE